MEAPAASHSQTSTAKGPDVHLTPAAAKAALAAGRKACRGLTPLQAAKRYAPLAREAGVRKSFTELVSHPSPAMKSSQGFPRLVAALYASTLPAPQRADAAAGCAEELSPGVPGVGHRPVWGDATGAAL